MDNPSEKLLFIDRFGPKLKGVELLVLLDICKDMKERNGLSSVTRSILCDIVLNFQSIVDKHNLPDPPRCFNIF